ncbi:MAG: TIGR00269 family protein [Candidatus Heimdallarchaeota archaeon]|nr:MAG: TIGR00269 family protein [Candidatus Heimdallarchaeota archaeon]
MSQTNCCQDIPFTQDQQSKKVYCKKHFTERIEKRVRKTINKYTMLNREDHIGLGYSGGKDSTVLLNILVKLKKQFSQCNLTALTIDEGIKGYREECLELTKKITKKYQIPHVIISFKKIYGATLDQIVEESLSKKHALSACSICGILRRRALNYAARQINATKIATAHNLDDEAQSILLNLLRGDSNKFIRFSRFPIQKFQTLIPRIRPFVRITEPEIVLYAYVKDLEYHSYPCPYAFSAMRNTIRTFLSEMEEKHPSTLRNIVNLHDSISRYFPQMGNLEPPFLCQKCGEVSAHEICPICQLLDNLGFQNPLKSEELLNPHPQPDISDRSRSF